MDTVVLSGAKPSLIKKHPALLAIGNPTAVGKLLASINWQEPHLIRSWRTTSPSFQNKVNINALLPKNWSFTKLVEYSISKGLTFRLLRRNQCNRSPKATYSITRNLGSCKVQHPTRDTIFWCAPKSFICSISCKNSSFAVHLDHLSTNDVVNSYLQLIEALKAIIIKPSEIITFYFNHDLQNVST